MSRISRMLRRITGLAWWPAIAIVCFPGFTPGQSIPSVEIDGAQFIVTTKGPDGQWTSRETDRVPLRPREACYTWRLHFATNTLGKLAWREEFTLPPEPGKDSTRLVTKKKETPRDGWLAHTWCVTRGDPVGQHVIKVYVQDSLAKAFAFLVVAPEALVGQSPAKGNVVYDACMDRETRAFQAQGHGDKSQTMARLVCQIVSSGPPDDNAVVERRMTSLNSVADSNIRRGEYGAAMRAYEEAIRMRPESSAVSRSRPRRAVQNNLAWLLATAPDSAVRDGPRALALAEQLAAWKPDDAAYLDTFAAAYAEVGRFEDAVRTEREAVARIGGAPRDEFRKHLRSYEGGKPWREP